MTDAQTSNRAMRLGLLAGIVALAVAALVVLGSSGGDEEVAPATPGESPFAGIAQDGNVLGDPDAPVTVIEYADLQCPACKAFSETVVPELVEDHVRAGEVKLVFRNFPFLGDDSNRAAAVAAAAAEQDKLWDFVHTFYARQGPENSGYATDAFLREVASAAGLDVDAVMAARSGDEARERLGTDATAAGKVGVDSTPSVYIGRDEASAKPVEWTGEGASAFTAAIDRLLR